MVVPSRFALHDGTSAIVHVSRRAVKQIIRGRQVPCSHNSCWKYVDARAGGVAYPGGIYGKVVGNFAVLVTVLVTWLEVNADERFRNEKGSPREWDDPLSLH